MNKTKKLVILAAIWIVGLVVWFYLVGCGFNYFLAQAIGVPDAMAKYVKYVPAYEDFGICSNEQDGIKENGAVALRAVLSNDYIYEENGYSHFEYATVFSSKNGSAPLFNGVWIGVCRDDNGRKAALKNGFALVDTEELINTFGQEELLSFAKATNSQRTVRINKYVLDNGICHPLSISLFDANGVLLKDLEGNKESVLAGMQVIEDDNAWLDTSADLQGKITAVLTADDNEAITYAKELSNKLDLSVNEKKAKIKVTPFRFTSFCTSVQDGYGMVHVAITYTEKFVSKWGFIVFGIWTSIMVVAGCISMFWKKK